MQDLINIICPYCGESFESFVDNSAGDQNYWEDCTVCCRPILFQVHVREDGGIEVNTLREDD